jgi:hypothetical protein
LLYRLGGEQLVSGDLSIKLFGNSDYGLFIADSRRKKKKTEWLYLPLDTSLNTPFYPPGRTDLRRSILLFPMATIK